MKRRPRPTLRHRLYRRLHPRAYRAGQLAEQKHILDGPLDYTRAEIAYARELGTPVYFTHSEVDAPGQALVAGPAHAGPVGGAA